MQKQRKKALHNYLKKIYPNAQYKKKEFKKNQKKESTEFYYGTPKIIEAFDLYLENIILKNLIPLKIEIEKQNRQKN